MIKEWLKWFETMTDLPVKSRAAFVDKIIDGLKSYRGKKGERGERWLSEFLEDKSQVELIGFAANATYVKVDSEHKDELKAIYVHPWGMPTLMYKHKHLPIVFMVGPGVRFNESVLEEIDKNDEPALRGITG
jgi:hypothetical protein